MTMDKENAQQNIQQNEQQNVKLKEQKNNPMHGVKLVTVLEVLVEHYGWEKLATKVNINCFKKDPSINSSLKFLRKEQWARDKVEELYLRLIKKL